ncbi:hypothetical protein [Streptomyces sp. bgisy095]|uniref:hypothetical protein n=1 Tax=unclassified Streptomyces TaxID=2593676 RepID=UPI003D739B48
MDAETGIRLDSAGYLEGTVGSGIFARVTLSLTHSRSSTAHGAVANHIHTALTNPGATTPLIVGMSVPGGTVNRPLNRLHEGWDAASATQCKKNITAKDNVCKPIRPTNL